MGILNDKPKNSKIDFSKVKGTDLEYFCASKHIDEAVMRGLKLEWKQELADDMERAVKFYFVVLKNRQYDMIAGPRFHEWAEKNGIGKIDEQTGDLINVADKYTIPTAKANFCKSHFITFLIHEQRRALDEGDRKLGYTLPGSRVN